MRRVPFALAGIAMAALTMGIQPAAAQKAEDAFGTWLHPDNGSHVQMYQCGARLCAKVVKVRDPSRRDAHNPDPKLRTRPVVGVVIMRGAAKSGDTTWQGRLYNTQDGQTYTGKITVLSRNQLKLEGCVLGGFICQGPTWSRVR